MSEPTEFERWAKKGRLIPASPTWCWTRAAWNAAIEAAAKRITELREVARRTKTYDDRLRAVAMCELQGAQVHVRALAESGESGGGK